MKFVIATQELNQMINKCLNVIAQKAAIPILSNLLIEAVGGRLIVTATDLTVGVRCVADAKILEEGGTALPGKKLSQLIRELTAANIEVTTNTHEVTEIVANDSRFKLHGMSKNEFPSLPDVTDATLLKMKQGDLKEALQRTAFAVSKDDTRYSLTGVCMTVQENVATFVGTDGKRLARCHASVVAEDAFSGSCILPIKAVDEIAKNLDEEGEVRLFILNDKIAIETDSIRIIAKLLAGEYPDVSRVIPESSALTVNLHREELTSLLRQVSLFTNEKEHSVRFTFSPGELRLSANTMEIGEGRVAMPVSYSGQPLDVAFNPSYFLDILRHTNGETVSLGLIDAFNPGVITESDKELAGQANPLYVLMPLRLKES